MYYKLKFDINIVKNILTSYNFTNLFMKKKTTLLIILIDSSEIYFNYLLKIRIDLNYK